MISIVSKLLFISCVRWQPSALLLPVFSLPPQVLISCRQQTPGERFRNHSLTLRIRARFALVKELLLLHCTDDYVFLLLTLTLMSSCFMNQSLCTVHSRSGSSNSKSNRITSSGTSLLISIRLMFLPRHVRDPLPHCRLCQLKLRLYPYGIISIR